MVILDKKSLLKNDRTLLWGNPSAINLNNSLSFTGGIGNQVAIMIAGLNQIVAFNQLVELNLKNIAHHMLDRRNTILGLKFEPHSLVGSVMASPRSKLPLVRKKRREINSRNPGYDSLIYDRYFGSNISGYFQSYLYKEHLENMIGQDISIDLQSYRKKFIDLMTHLSIADSLIIHIRRGDYRVESQNRGLLGLGYYSTAFGMIPRSEYKNIIVMTDAENLEEISFIKDVCSEVCIIGKDFGLLSSEILFLMSRAKFLIMANSSLSWSAALFLANKKQVLYPYRWFRKEENFKLQFNPDWIEVKPAATSIWVQS